jgi:ribosome maturation factor RimP
LSIKYYCLILRRGESMERGPKSPILLGFLMIEKEKIRQLVVSETEKQDIILVDLQVKPGNQIKIVLDSFSGVSIDKCVEISKLIENNFDRETEDYELEVSSYGISQAFIVPLQYQKNLGKNVEVHLNNGKISKGVLKHYEFENEKLKCIEILIKKKVQLEGKKRKTEIEEINNVSGEEIRKVLLLLDF